jgi:hypothetical protein
VFLYKTKRQNETEQEMKYTHRVAVMVATQVIMDIEAENDVESIKKEALISHQSGEGDPEQGMSFVKSVVIYPWLEEGQKPPKGSSYPKPTELEITLDEQASIMSNPLLQ